MSRLVLTALAAAGVAVVMAGCGGSHANTNGRTLTNLQDISQLRTAFNAASGEPRLIVLVSPT